MEWYGSSDLIPAYLENGVFKFYMQVEKVETTAVVEEENESPNMLSGGHSAGSSVSPSRSVAHEPGAPQAKRAQPVRACQDPNNSFLGLEISGEVEVGFLEEVNAEEEVIEEHVEPAMEYQDGTRKPVTRERPKDPTSREREQHEEECRANYRSWCKACV